MCIPAHVGESQEIWLREATRETSGDISSVLNVPQPQKNFVSNCNKHNKTLYYSKDDTENDTEHPFLTYFFSYNVLAFEHFHRDTLIITKTRGIVGANGVGFHKTFKTRQECTM